MNSKDYIQPLKNLCLNYKNDIVDGPFGSNMKRSDYIGNGIPVLKIQNVKPFNIEIKKMDFVSESKFRELKRHSFKKGDIIMTKLGDPLGASAIVEDIEFGLIVADLVRISAGKVDSKYLCYHLNSPTTSAFINSQQKGATRPRVQISVVRELPIYAPPLPEQQRIVAILDEAFAAIDKAKSNAEQNLTNAKELFESYLQGVFINRGEGWEEKKWGDLCHFVRGPFGGSLKKSIFKEEGYVVYEQKHAIHDHFNQLRYFIDEDKFNEMIRFEVKPGDLIMSCSGVTLGRVAVIPEGIPRGIINQALLKLTPNKNVSVHFLKYWLRSKIFQDIIFKYSGGAAIPNVPSAKILKEITIPLPTLGVQIDVVNKIEMMMAETSKLEAIYQKKIDNLEELKQSILQKAFSGELKTVEEAVGV